MKLSAFSIIWAIIYLGFGLGLLLIPALFMTTYGVKLDAGGAFMTRLLGSAQVAYAFNFLHQPECPLNRPHATQHHDR